MKNYSKALLLLGVLFAGCEKKTLKNPEAGTVADLTGKNVGQSFTGATQGPLKWANPTQSARFAIGASINADFLSNTTFTDLIKLHYNSFTAENNMKFGQLHPAETTWVWNINDALTTLVASVDSGHIHGHNLIWYKNVPQWVLDKETGNRSIDSARFELIMKTHIKTVIQHFFAIKAKDGTPIVKSWDVVNEAWYDSGKGLRGDSTSTDAIGCIWERTIGPNYIAHAFSYARAAAQEIGDYNLKLFYNDYNLEKPTKKLKAVYDMLLSLKAAPTVYNKPIIDGVGTQTHIDWNTDRNRLKAVLDTLARTLLYVHVSELDIKLTDDSTHPPYTPDTTQLNKQTALFYDIPMLYRKYVPAVQRWGITTWNVGDNDASSSWIWINHVKTQQNSATIWSYPGWVKKAGWTKFYNGLGDTIPAGF